jgi:hypothetical protein
MRITTINRGGTKKIIKPHEYIAKVNQRCKIQKQQKKRDNLKRNGKNKRNKKIPKKRGKTDNRRTILQL